LPYQGGDLGNIAAKAAVFAILNAVSGGGFSKAISMKNFVFDGLFKANGGPVSGGNPYIVGERGPELFVPKTAGTIIPNGVGRTVYDHSRTEIHIHEAMAGKMVTLTAEQFAAMFREGVRDGRIKVRTT
jgi:phage-related minor tail protein